MDKLRTRRVQWTCSRCIWWRCSRGIYDFWYISRHTSAASSSYITKISSLDVSRSQLIGTYLFYFKTTRDHKDIIRWSPQLSSSLLSHRCYDKRNRLLPEPARFFFFVQGDDYRTCFENFGVRRSNRYNFFFVEHRAKDQNLNCRVY